VSFREKFLPKERMSKTASVIPVMKGGAKEYILDIVRKQWSPIEVYILIFMGLSIVFVREIPLNIRRYADTFLGRLALFAITVAITMKTPWINAALFVIFTLLLLSMSPRSSEGFQTTSKKEVPKGNLWFVEATLKENPVEIIDEEADTDAIQSDYSSKSSVVGMTGASASK
jgi:uncharacterized membrane protein YfbV (UPF0208 family)